VLSAGIDQKYNPKGGYTFAPVVIYDYNVNGQTYRSDRVYYSRVYGSRGQSSVINYTPGTEVTVYYNPHNPSQAVLKTGNPSTRYIQVFMAGAFFMAGVILLLI